MCDKSSDVPCKIYCGPGREGGGRDGGMEGGAQNLSGRWAVNNNSAQQQEKYAQEEKVNTSCALSPFSNVHTMNQNDRR